MSPHIALHDPVFRNYFWIVLISLAIAGAVLAFLRFVSKKETTSMFKTYYSWILIAGLGFIVVFSGRIPTIVGITLLAICAFKEFARASGNFDPSRVRTIRLVFDRTPVGQVVVDDIGFSAIDPAYLVAQRN